MLLYFFHKHYLHVENKKKQQVSGNTVRFVLYIICVQTLLQSSRYGSYHTNMESASRCNNKSNAGCITDYMITKVKSRIFSQLLRNL